MIEQVVSDQMSEGLHTVIWNGKDESGKKSSSGIYFYKLKTKKKEMIKKMLLMK